MSHLSTVDPMINPPTSSTRELENFIGGNWTPAQADSFLDVENPSTGEVLAQVPASSKADVSSAIAAADKAFKDWARTPVSERVSYLYKLLDLIRRDEESLARTITLENGKSLPDSRAEMKRLVQNLETACGMPMLQQGEKLIGAASDIDGEVIRLPMGVFTMFGPFNFPAMVPFWFIPYAIAAGNTYVVKPSEQTPCTMHRITELIEEAGLPKGVFNLVHGDQAVAHAFMEHPAVKGVSMVGSSRVARMVAEKCAANGKRFQAMGSAKNHLVVMPDSKIEEVIRNMITSCYGCAGQRCMAASAIVCVGRETYDQVIDKFVEASRDVIVADPLDPKVANESMVCGPVISHRAKQRIHDLVEAGLSEGATLALDGRGVVVKDRENGHYIGPTVFVDVKPGMSIHREEIFGPVAVILMVDVLDEAIEIINNHQFGNGASIYTQSGHAARKFKIETEAGMIGVNVGIPAPVAYLPFGGMRSSQFADIKAQGRAVVNFFTQDKIITERFWPDEER